jgi:hypothetical protein
MPIEDDQKEDEPQKIELSKKINEATEEASRGKVRSRWRDWKPLENDTNLDQHSPAKKKNDPG